MVKYKKLIIDLVVGMGIGLGASIIYEDTERAVLLACAGVGFCQSVYFMLRSYNTSQYFDIQQRRISKLNHQLYGKECALNRRVDAAEVAALKSGQQLSRLTTILKELVLAASHIYDCEKDRRRKLVEGSKVYQFSDERVKNLEEALEQAYAAGFADYQYNYWRRNRKNTKVSSKLN